MWEVSNKRKKNVDKILMRSCVIKRGKNKEAKENFQKGKTKTPQEMDQNNRM